MGDGKVQSGIAVSCIALVLLPRGESHKRPMVCRGDPPFRNPKKAQKAEKDHTKSMKPNPSKRHANLPVENPFTKKLQLADLQIFRVLDVASVH